MTDETILHEDDVKEVIDEEIAEHVPTGILIVRAFPFAFDTPDLLTGVALYTPTVGDILLDAWIEVFEAWDGTTPKGDLGTFTGGRFGVWSNGNAPLDLTQVDDTSVDNGLLNQVVGSGNQNMPLSSLNAVAGGSNLNRMVPAKFITTDPIKVVVSRDGTNNPGAEFIEEGPDTVESGVARVAGPFQCDAGTLVCPASESGPVLRVRLNPV